MSILNLVSANVRVENGNDVNRKYKVSASVSVNDENVITSIVSGQCNLLDEGESQVAYFDSNRDGSINYKFNGVNFEQQQELINIIGNFISVGQEITITV